MVYFSNGDEDSTTNGRSNERRRHATLESILMEAVVGEVKARQSCYGEETREEAMRRLTRQVFRKEHLGSASFNELISLCVKVRYHTRGK